jgi:hypothetical protein
MQMERLQDGLLLSHSANVTENYASVVVELDPKTPKNSPGCGSQVSRIHKPEFGSTGIPQALSSHSGM